MDRAPSPTAPEVRKTRRRSVPLITSIIIILLVAACTAEGFLIYLKQLQVTASSQATDQARGRISKLEREKENTENTLGLYYTLVGAGDIAPLQEKVRNSTPPTVRGYISELEGKLQTTATKLDELQTGWDAMQRTRDDAIKAAEEAKSEATRSAEQFSQKVGQLTEELKAERERHQGDVKALEDEVAGLKKDLKDADDVSQKAVEAANKESRRHRAVENWYKEHLTKVRVLLALSLRIPPEDLDLNESVLTEDLVTITLTTSGEEPVRFPSDPRLQEGMRFVIYGRQRQAKCLVQLVNVLPDKALGQVVEKYPQYSPVSSGDVAKLDLAFEELRGLPEPPSSLGTSTTGGGSVP